MLTYGAGKKVKFQLIEILVLSGLNAPESINIISIQSGGINVSWEEPRCRHGRAASLQVFYAPVVTFNDRWIFPLIFSQIVNVTKTNTKSYYISGADIDRNKTYAIWLQLVALNGRGFSSEIVLGNSLLKCE